MTDENVVQFPGTEEAGQGSNTEEPERGSPWRVTGVRYREGQVLLQGSDGSAKVTNAFVLNIQFLDREPSRLITNSPGDHGFRSINIPIPIGVSEEQLYQVLKQVEPQVRRLLHGPPDEPPPEGKEMPEDPEEVIANGNV